MIQLWFQHLIVVLKQNTVVLLQRCPILLQALLTQVQA